MTRDNAEIIFVFGSNLAGIHGAGAALDAKYDWNAEYGIGLGRTGDAYALPTKDINIKTLPLESIRKYVKEFVEHAKKNPKQYFYVTAFGTGLAGYTVPQIKRLFGNFKDLPYNIVFTKDWF